MIEFLWSIVWAIMPYLLGVGKDLLANAFTAVKWAQEQEGMTNEEKRAYVLNSMKEHLAGAEVSTHVKNLILELAVSYMKVQIKGNATSE